MFLRSLRDYWHCHSRETGFEITYNARLDTLFKESGVQKSQLVCETFFSTAIESKILYCMS